MGGFLDTALIAAAVSAIVTALGWLAAYGTTVRLENRRREEKVADVQTALLAEIRAAAHTLGQYDPKALIDDVSRRMGKSAKAGYRPFVPREPGSPVYRAVIGEISILPNDVIDAVVLFYNQQQVIEHFAEDLRGDRFAALPNEQKLRMLEDFLELKAFERKLANRAIAALRGSLGVNKSDADPSDRQSASSD